MIGVNFAFSSKNFKQIKIELENSLVKIINRYTYINFRAIIKFYMQLNIDFY